jgi:hypothetical protein
MIRITSSCFLIYSLPPSDFFVALDPSLCSSCSGCIQDAFVEQIYRSTGRNIYLAIDKATGIECLLQLVRRSTDQSSHVAEDESVVEHSLHVNKTISQEDMKCLVLTWKSPEQLLTFLENLKNDESAADDPVFDSLSTSFLDSRCV